MKKQVLTYCVGAALSVSAIFAQETLPVYLDDRYIRTRNASGVFGR